MNSFLSAVRELLGETKTPEKSTPAIGPSQLIIIGPSEMSRPVIGPAVTTVAVVEPPARAAWDEKGWTKEVVNGVPTYSGAYKVFDKRTQRWRTFQGYVREDKSKTAVYIADPPPEIQKHPKGPCFMLTTAPWFYLNWSKAAKNVNDSILYMERLLWESFNVYGRG